MLQHCAAIADYAICKAVLELNPFTPLRKALKPETVTHMAAITEPKQFGELMRAIDGYEGDVVTRHGLQLLALFFVRPTELRTMRWTDIDFEQQRWCLQASDKKEKRDHIVPLASQAIGILRDLQAMTGNGTYVLGSRLGDRVLSENTLNSALRRLGFAKGIHTSHGFRASARTMLDEVLKFPADIIEHQLAHRVSGPLGATYNRTTKLPERAAMMQAWGDYLDQLRKATRE